MLNSFIHPAIMQLCRYMTHCASLLLSLTGLFPLQDSTSELCGISRTLVLASQIHTQCTSRKANACGNANVLCAAVKLAVVALAAPLQLQCFLGVRELRRCCIPAGPARTA